MGRLAAVPVKGFTAIELLIYASIGALIAAFAVPFVKQAIHQTELEQALKITEESIQQARRTARIYHTDVVMRIESEGGESQDAIHLSIPEMQKDSTLNMVTEEFPMPAGIDIVSSEMVIRFDSAGEVEWPASLMIVSQKTGDPSEHLLIQ